MPKRSRVASIACSIGLLVLAGAFAHSSARAQSADLVLCDRLAAEPSDPDKPKDVKGVTEIAPSDIATAIKFCRTASVSSRRAMYQLGRAYAANKQVAEAVSAYRDRGIKPGGVTNPDTFMVRAVSLTLPENTSWVDFGRPHMAAKLGADFGYAL